MGDGLDLVRLAAMANRGLSPFYHSRRTHRAVSLSTVDAAGEGAHLRVECREAVRGGCERETKRSAVRLPGAHQNELLGRGAGTEPPAVWLGTQLVPDVKEAAT